MVSKTQLYAVTVFTFLFLWLLVGLEGASIGSLIVLVIGLFME